jgi:hypothetical protein
LTTDFRLLLLRQSILSIDHLMAVATRAADFGSTTPYRLLSRHRYRPSRRFASFSKALVGRSPSVGEIPPTLFLCGLLREYRNDHCLMGVAERVAQNRTTTVDLASAEE